MTRLCCFYCRFSALVSILVAVLHGVAVAVYLAACLEWSGSVWVEGLGEVWCTVLLKPYSASVAVSPQRFIWKFQSGFPCENVGRDPQANACGNEDKLVQNFQLIVPVQEFSQHIMKNLNGISTEYPKEPAWNCWQILHRSFDGNVIKGDCRDQNGLWSQIIPACFD